jgi:hypothetical protein
MSAAGSSVTGAFGRSPNDLAALGLLMAKPMSSQKPAEIVSQLGPVALPIGRAVICQR